MAVSSNKDDSPSWGNIYKSSPLSEAKPCPAKNIWISLPPSPAIFGNHNLNALRVWDLVALSSTRIFIFDSLTPRAFVA